MKFAWLILLAVPMVGPMASAQQTIAPIVTGSSETGLVGYNGTSVLTAGSITVSGAFTAPAVVSCELDPQDETKLKSCNFKPGTTNLEVAQEMYDAMRQEQKAREDENTECQKQLAVAADLLEENVRSYKTISADLSAAVADLGGDGTHISHKPGCSNTKRTLPNVLPCKKPAARKVKTAPALGDVAYSSGTITSVTMPIDGIASCDSDVARLTGGWKRMSTAPHDRTVESLNTYGIAPTYTLVRWDASRGPAWTIVSETGKGGGFLSDNCLYWRLYAGDLEKYVDPTRGAQNTVKYWCDAGHWGYDKNHDICVAKAVKP